MYFLCFLFKKKGEQIAHLEFQTLCASAIANSWGSARLPRICLSCDFKVQFLAQSLDKRVLLH